MEGAALKRLAIFFNDDITQGEIARVLRDAGLHMHTEAGHRLVVDRVPAMVRKPEVSNVVRMSAPPRRLKGGQR